MRLATICVLVFTLGSKITSCDSYLCELCGYNQKLYPVRLGGRASYKVGHLQGAVALRSREQAMEPRVWIPGDPLSCSVAESVTPGTPKGLKIQVCAGAQGSVGWWHKIGDWKWPRYNLAFSPPSQACFSLGFSAGRPKLGRKCTSWWSLTSSSSWLWHFLWIFLESKCEGHPSYLPPPLILPNRSPSQLLFTKYWMMPRPGNHLTTTGTSQTAPGHHPESIMRPIERQQKEQKWGCFPGDALRVTSCHVTATGPVIGGPPGCSGHCIS